MARVMKATPVTIWTPTVGHVALTAAAGKKCELIGVYLNTITGYFATTAQVMVSPPTGQAQVIVEQHLFAANTWVLWWQFYGLLVPETWKVTLLAGTTVGNYSSKIDYVEVDV